MSIIKKIFFIVSLLMSYSMVTYSAEDSYDVGERLRKSGNLVEAEKYYKLAADREDSEWAQYNLAYFIYQKNGDLEKAEEYYKKAAAKGNEWAEYNLAYYIYHQNGSLQKAREYYERAAEKGNQEAIKMLNSLK